MGFHEAKPTSSDFTFASPDLANLQVHLVRRQKESKDAKFVITNTQGNVYAETQFLRIYTKTIDGVLL